MLVDLPKHNMRIFHADWDKVVINVQQGPIHVHECAYLKVVIVARCRNYTIQVHVECCT